MPATTRRDANTKNILARFEDVLARIGARGRVSMEKHLATCDAEAHPGHAQLWRRLAGGLGVLAPLPVQTEGQHALLFYVPDGKYRMQAFALEDRRDGLVNVYLPDVLAEAVREKVLVKAGEGYALPGPGGQTLRVQAMTAANTPQPTDFYKHMLGWNRKALKITLDATEADSPQVAATEALCALAARKWAAPAEK